jgi:hypothetical protein
MQEIVGALINGRIVTNNMKNIAIAFQSGKLNQLYDRSQMKFMSKCDLGHNWDLMANGPTLFLIDDNGKPQWH